MFRTSSFVLLLLLSANVYAHTIPGAPHAHPHGSAGYLAPIILGACFVVGLGAYAFLKLKRIFNK
ncbi:MAG: hypothetical protein A3F16_02535 [Deltaproteobacteria bacterium RIFCSPHIGHO2_12_FULL_43_9]|nr:MAG: hypothetical protein A3F16_02535 [Deltaproteobacteria bacterium RIFCSPHIGHO2_12_FULL_43_9]